MTAGILPLFPVAETSAEHSCDALVPWQLTEGLGVRNSDQLRGFRAVADVLTVAIEIQIRGRAVDELEMMWLKRGADGGPDRGATPRTGRCDSNSAW